MANYTVKGSLILNAASSYSNIDGDFGYKMPHNQTSENVPTWFNGMVHPARRGNSGVWITDIYADETHVYFQLCYENVMQPADFPAKISYEYGIQDVTDLTPPEE